MLQNLQINGTENMVIKTETLDNMRRDKTLVLPDKDTN
jgi:hypothetical protein